MRLKLKSYFLLLVNVILGIGVLVVTQKLKIAWLDPSVLILLFFIALNIGYRYMFSLGAEMREFWNLKKSYYFLIGTVGGLLIAALPVAINLATGRVGIENVVVNPELSILTALSTLAIVAWEEFWFRGLLLNYCQRHIPIIVLSIVIGALFMGVHMFNPEMHFLEQGPALFFAGAFLTLLYFFYRTIWLPLGLHFGNNFFGSMLKVDNGPGLFAGEDGYTSAIILALLFIFFAIRLKVKQAADLAVAEI